MISYSTNKHKKQVVSKNGFLCGIVLLIAILVGQTTKVFGGLGGYIYYALYYGRYLGTLLLFGYSMRHSVISNADVKRFVSIIKPIFILLICIQLISFITSPVPKMYGIRYWTRVLSIFLDKGFIYFLAITVWKLRGSKAIKTLLTTLLIDQFLVVLSVIIRYGLSGMTDSVKSVFSFQATSTNYFEVHELTFCIGLILIYYLFFAPNKNKWIILVLSFFFILGGKRIGFAGIIAAGCFGFLVKKKGLSKKKITVTGCLGVIICFLFLLLIYNNQFISLLNQKEISDMGRGLIYSYFTNRTSYSPSFLGWGLAGTSKVIENMDRGEISYMQSVRGVHSSILDSYINYGFLGYHIWSIIQLVYIPRKFFTLYGKKTATLYISLLLYAYVTYLTDNTEGYFMFQTTLLLVPLSESCEEIKKRGFRL